MRRALMARLIGILGVSGALLGCPGLFELRGQEPSDNTPKLDTAKEKAEIAALLDSQAYRPFFEPSKLVNDGVGIFSGGDDGSDGLPRRWGRSYPKTTQAGTSVVEQMTIDFKTDASRQLTADATFSQSRSARFVADYAWQQKFVTKPYTETARRTARLVKHGASWELDSLSPMALTPSSPKLAITMVRIKVDGAPALMIQQGERVASDMAPRVQPGAQAMVEVKVEGPAGVPVAQPVWTFMSRPPLREHVPLKDEGNGLYSGTFTFPQTSGWGHLVIDAVSDDTFTDLTNGTYDAAVWGVSYLVLGGDAR